MIICVAKQRLFLSLILNTDSHSLFSIQNWKWIFEFLICVKDLTRIYRSGLVKIFGLWILEKKMILMHACANDFSEREMVLCLLYSPSGHCHLLYSTIYCAPILHKNSVKITLWSLMYSSSLKNDEYMTDWMIEHIIMFEPSYDSYHRTKCSSKQINAGSSHLIC